MSTTGKKTRTVMPSWIKQASPDSPFYKNGYVLGAARTTKSSIDTDAAHSTKAEALRRTVDELNAEIAKELPRQFGKTDESI